MKVKENFNLKTYNTFSVNATAKYFAECSSVEAILEAIQSRQFQGSQQLIIGSGSNILFTQNFDGFILKPGLTGIHKVKETKDQAILRVYNGEIWDDWVSFCVEQNYSGLENLSWIPGNVGASVVQNIGAYGAEVKDAVLEVEALHIKSGSIEIFNNMQCDFGYRSSIFKTAQKDQFIILSATFKLSKKFCPVLNYSGIKSALKNCEELTPKTLREAIINIRKSKLPDPRELGNAGSFFKNPVIPKKHFKNLHKAYHDLKFYEISGNEYKIPAGWLIDKCGWKGRRTGAVGTYPQQALIIVNYGNATGPEIFEFSQKIQTAVKKKFDIMLEEEVRIV